MKPPTHILNKIGGGQNLCKKVKYFSILNFVWKVLKKGKFWPENGIPATLNAKMVRAPQYLEGPSISPVVVPAQQSESVALNLFNSNVLINASLVVKEVPNHFEGGLHWAIVHQLHFNFLQIFRNSLLNLAVCFVLTEGYLYCKSHIDNKENLTSS